VVDLQDDAAGFADACVRVVEDCPDARAQRGAALLHEHHWDTIAARMDSIMQQAHCGAELEVSA